ncbi:hypothetical protein [Bellilinea caldifistulae]|nr:hypothetical protein [Bellilinea caldifistulae]
MDYNPTDSDNPAHPALPLREIAAPPAAEKYGWLGRESRCPHRKW